MTDSDNPRDEQTDSESALTADDSGDQQARFNSTQARDLTENGGGVSGITFRSVVIGLIIIVLFSWAVPYNDYYLRGTFMTGNHLPLGAVFIFIVLILLVNVCLKTLRPGLELSPVELVVIWCMVIVTAGIPVSGLMRYFFSLLVGPFYYATEANRWEEYVLRYIPKHLVPSTDPKSPVIVDFFEKLPEGASVPWAAWKTPLMYWGVFIALLYFIMFCLCVILRKQWVERERLSFPLVYLPMEMVGKPETKSLINSFFKSKVVWIGFFIPFTIHLLNGLHGYFPSVPTVRTTFPLRELFTERPWNAMQMDAMRIYPSAVAFVYLLTLEVSFSLWFFYIFLQGEYVLGSLFGRPLGGDWQPFAVHQQAGAFLVLAGLLLWRARRHLADVVKKAIWRDYPVDDSNEAFSYRTAFFGLIAAVILISLWCRFVAGMSFFISFLAILMFIAIVIVLTRLVTQGGMLFIYQNFCPYDLIVTTIGSSAISPATLSLLAIQNIIFIHDARELMMPSIMNSFKMTDGVGLKRKWLMLALVLAIVVSLFASGYFFLSLTYKYGGSNLDWFGMRSVFNFKLLPFSSKIRNPAGTDWDNVRYMGYGAGLMAFTFIMGQRYYWWPFHPLGLLLANSFAMRHFWFSIFLGWAIKASIMKYGGGKAYKDLRGLFMGAVLGECFIGGVWIIIGFITKKQGVINIMPI